MTKVGIIGGAFDPPHTGHIELARSVLMSEVVNEVWLMPCQTHLYNKKMEAFGHRLRMCKLAVKGSPIKVFDYENIRNLSGSTLETFQSLKKEPYSASIEYYCVIGLDNANTINLWKNQEDLIKSVRFIIVKRPGFEKINGAWYDSRPHLFINTLTPDVSSTSIRKFLSDISRKINMVSPDVLSYIEKNNLYKGA